MFSIIKNAIQFYLALALTDAAVQILRITVVSGLPDALSQLPNIVLHACIRPFTMLVEIVKSIIKAAVEIMKKILIAVMQLPIDVAWGVLPGLETVPKPKVTELFK